MSFAHNTVICTHHFLYLAILSYFIFILLWLLLMSPCSTCLHIPPPPRTVMLILIFNSTAYCHAHSLILYILYSVLYILFFIHFILCILPLLYSTIFALSMERTWFTFHCWLYNLCIVVYVTNKTWNLKLEKCLKSYLNVISFCIFLYFGFLANEWIARLWHYSETIKGIVYPIMTFFFWRTL